MTLLNWDNWVIFICKHQVYMRFSKNFILWAKNKNFYPIPQGSTADFAWVQSPLRGANPWIFCDQLDLNPTPSQARFLREARTRESFVHLFLIGTPNHFDVQFLKESRLAIWTLLISSDMFNPHFGNRTHKKCSISWWNWIFIKTSEILIDILRPTGFEPHPFPGTIPQGSTADFAWVQSPLRGANPWIFCDQPDLNPTPSQARFLREARLISHGFNPHLGEPTHEYFATNRIWTPPLPRHDSLGKHGWFRMGSIPP